MVIRLDIEGRCGWSCGASCRACLVLPHDAAVFRVDACSRSEREMSQLANASTGRASKFGALHAALSGRGSGDHGGDILCPQSGRRISSFHHHVRSFDRGGEFLAAGRSRIPTIVAIKQTLYRTSARFPHHQGACRSGRSGQSVTALVELKAPFRRGSQYPLGARPRTRGVQVVFGFIELNQPTQAFARTASRRRGACLVCACWGPATIIR